MKTIGIDTEYDYCDPFLATTTDEELLSRVYRLKVLSQKREIKQICESRNIRKVFHHATGDIFQFRNIGIRVADPVECTLIASNLVDENYKPRNLKKLVQIHLGIDTHEANRLKSTIAKYKKLAEKGGYQFKWSQIPESVMIPYAKRDPEYTIKLWFYWQTPLQESIQLYEFEKSLIPLIVEMQCVGLRIDRYRCRRTSDEYGRKIEGLYDEMSKYLVDNHIDLGKDFNPRSPKQIQQIIMDMELEETVEHNKQTHVPKTDKKALAILSIDSLFFSLVSKHRFFTKHKGTYYDPLYSYYTSEKNDVAHFLMYQTGAKTGRFSVELAQTFPKPEESKLAGELHEVRKCIIPRRGKAFLCMDYEQQEMRLFCHYSNCERMIEIINKKSGTKGFDIYVESADMMFGELFQRERLRKALRFTTKTDALGMIYGMGQNKLVKSTTGLLYEKFDRSIVEEIGVSDQWAYDTLKSFKELYPVDEFNRECMSELYKTGVMELSFNSELMKFKREYRIPRDFAYKAGNAKIQGCLSGGARVYTQEYGYVTLKEIVDQVVTIWDGDRFVKAQCLYSGKKQKVVVILMNGQQLICSPEHKFLRCTKNDRGVYTTWSKSKDLKCWNKVVVTKAIIENQIGDIKSYLQDEFISLQKGMCCYKDRCEINFLDIEEFDLGVLLGRLVSDGSIGTSGRSCIWYIAEHEYGIGKYIKDKLSLLGDVKVCERDLKKIGKNQNLATLSLHSIKLVRLLSVLKNDIPFWMYMNTELLKGYLRGLFDGDGHVTKHNNIVLTLGGKTSSIFVRKIQEALLILGIRSRLLFYNKTERRFHLSIYKRDNLEFAKNIGFINDKKQEKIKDNGTKKDDKEYRGIRVETVKLVSIKDEEIDMYDIVNSESGKYVANGIVTHNTAAYILKHAMLRCQNRIIKEKWQEKVTMILTVHDELIFEVDNNLSFIKQVYQTLKQEMDDTVTFKVPITTSGKYSSISLGDVKELV